MSVEVLGTLVVIGYFVMFAAIFSYVRRNNVKTLKEKKLNKYIEAGAVTKAKLFHSRASILDDQKPVVARGQVLYDCTYEYYVNDKRYKKKVSLIGKTNLYEDIIYNPKNPKKAYFYFELEETKNQAYKRAYWIPALICLAIMIIYGIINRTW